jgi:Mn2+/Fe2+ NRAMP family transporter
VAVFFEQSNVVDERITARWLSYERFDTLIGIFFGVGACAVFLTCAFAFGGTSLHGAFVDGVGDR